ncbi:MAG: twin-arginine translocation signal domain-containing protein [Planctomycetes bacterium]|nr:twin-arginine translocation signal domain-containing protein [Planctomycetota bacterium]
MSGPAAKSWGVFCILFGIAAFGWMSYLLLVDDSEQIRPSGFLKGYALAAGAVGVGVWRIRGPSKASTSERPQESGSVPPSERG